ncbi:MAG: hypothetical protein K6A93_11740 [Bacteroidaceae bacterium]|nr:hypothetical protein [Bacteroidaceae bacterium]
MFNITAAECRFIIITTISGASLPEPPTNQSLDIFHPEHPKHADTTHYHVGKTLSGINDKAFPLVLAPAFVTGILQVLVHSRPNDAKNRREYLLTATCLDAVSLPKPLEAFTSQLVKCYHRLQMMARKASASPTC